MSDTPLERVFVYGTLKRGFCNHALLDEAEFIGEATTVERFGFYLGADDYAPEVDEIPYLYRHPRPLMRRWRFMARFGKSRRPCGSSTGSRDIRTGTSAKTSKCRWIQRPREVQAYLRPGLPSAAYRPIEGGCF